MSIATACGGVILPPGYVKGGDLAVKAKSLPTLDLRFAESKSLTDAASGQSLVTFTHASSGTYVGSNGVLQTATTNLLLRSEDLTTTWTNFNSTEAADTAIAPNGTLTADTLIPNNGVTDGLIRQDISGTLLPDNSTVSFSVYVKTAGLTNLSIQFYNKANTFHGSQTVNTSTGSLSGSGTLTTTAVSAVGDGWYRVSLTGMTAGSGATTPNVRIIITSTGNGTSGIYLWGAQLEQSSIVGEYIPTTSTINSAPRFDHNPTTGESLGLLVEEQRTNLHLQSGNLSGYSFTASGAGDALTNFYGTAADGASNKTLRVQTGSLIRTIRWVDNGCGIDAISTQYTVSFFYRGTLPLSVSARVGNTPSLTVIYPPSGSLMGRAQAVITSGTNATAFLDLTYPANSDGELWGIQVEKSVAFPTSYIPTTTATATRSADVASITGTNLSSFYSNTGSTALGYARSIGASTGTENVLGFGAALDGAQIRETNSQMIGMFRGTYGTDANSFLLPAGLRKMVIAYAPASTSVFAMNGIVYTGGTSSATLTNPNAMGIGSNGEINSPWNGTISRITYWPQRLADPTLQAITQ